MLLLYVFVSDPPIAHGKFAACAAGRSLRSGAGGLGHQPVAGAITHPELQGVDANCVSAVVDSPFVGRSNLFQPQRLQKK